VFATTHACKARKIIHFAEGSFTGSPALQRLDDVVERVDRMNFEGSDPQKAVAVLVTARVEKSWFTRAPGILPPQAGYVLRLLDADDGRLVEQSDDLFPPLPPGLK
jgi:hypothetical protein